MLSSPLPVRRAACAGALLSVALLGACTPKDNKPASPAASASASASAPAAAEPEETRGGEDEIRPVYPLKVALQPLAQRFCEALHDLPLKRKAECCGAEPGFSITSECVRTLSFAIQEKSVTIDPADIDRCVEALNKTYEGCAWVGPNPRSIPDACRGIIKGAVPNGGVCRSSLDCAVGMHCQGAGPTHLGACAPPLETRFACELSIDTLAAHTRQDNVEAQHPECTGYCTRHRCLDAAPLGGACKVSPECGPRRTCVSGKCSDAPLPVAGEPCPGGGCAGDARCLKGMCITPRGEGEECALDAECRGGCARPDGGTKGKCEKRCGL